jgi:DNA-binding transcriptional ArsR family regulator
MVYQHTQVLDATFGALADPTRREILARLATGERTIKELAGRFDMSLPAVSKHVRVLERAGLATVERHGRARRARLVAAPMQSALAWIERYRVMWESELDRLAAYLEATTPAESSWKKPPSPPPRRSSKSAEPSARRGNASSTRGRNRKK